MSAEFHFIFFKPAPAADPLKTGRSLFLKPDRPRPPKTALPLDVPALLAGLKATRGFARLKINLPNFELDKPRLDVFLDGHAYPSHLHINLRGNFDKLAGPLFAALSGPRGLGLTCYCFDCDAILDEWPDLDAPGPPEPPPEADPEFRVLERETLRLRALEPDPARRVALLNEFLASPTFQSQLAAERAKQPNASPDAPGPVS